MKNVEIRHVSHRNKGAELMLLAVRERLGSRDDVRLVGSHRVGTRQQRAALGLAPLSYLYQKRYFFSPPRLLFPGLLRRALGIVHPCDLDVVLDAAGFNYGDQWGPARSLHSADYYRYVRRHGARVVLMPQSFGPFEDPATREAALRLFDEVDLIFPRDDTSFEAVRGLIGEDPRVAQVPDFTPLLSGKAVEDVQLPERPVAMIPNRKMTEKAGLSTEEYVAFMAKAVETIQQEGFCPFMLPHAVFDHDLARQINAGLSTPIPVIVEEDARRLKSIIGECEFVVCSRFHGLVSALCQGVPVIATSWSHKYKHLMSEYESADRLVDPASVSADELRALIRDDVLRSNRETLVRRARWHKDTLNAMWQRIEELLSDKPLLRDA